MFWKGQTRCYGRQRPQGALPLPPRLPWPEVGRFQAKPEATLGPTRRCSAQEWMDAKGLASGQGAAGAAGVLDRPHAGVAAVTCGAAGPSPCSSLPLLPEGISLPLWPCLLLVPVGQLQPVPGSWLNSLPTLAHSQALFPSLMALKPISLLSPKITVSSLHLALRNISNSIGPKLSPQSPT